MIKVHLSCTELEREDTTRGRRPTVIDSEQPETFCHRIWFGVKSHTWKHWTLDCFLTLGQVIRFELLRTLCQIFDHQCVKVGRLVLFHFQLLSDTERPGRLMCPCFLFVPCLTSSDHLRPARRPLCWNSEGTHLFTHFLSLLKNVSVSTCTSVYRENNLFIFGDTDL